MLIATAVAAWVAWIAVPGSAIDGAAFSAVVRGFANPPFFISGNGSHGNPWQLRTLTPAKRKTSDESPVFVALGDDLEGFFQSSPPSPIDLAVIFSNMQRLGSDSAATAAVLAWDAPDPIGLMALDKAIARFDTLVMAAPLSRGSSPEPMPPTFRKASIPLQRLHGNPSFLPVVNRVPLPGIILGKENTLAGFQTLDSEPTTRFLPLLARWDDRAVFAFPLLAALQRLGVSLENIEVRLGEYIKLGPGGPVIPLDRYGRMPIRLKPTSSPAKIPAETLIDGGDELFSSASKLPMILLDDRSNAGAATRAFTKILPAAVSAIESDTVLAPAQTYPRLPAGQEFLLLSVITIALTSICQVSTFTRNIGFLAIAAVCISTQCIAAGTGSLWLPAIPALAAILTSFCFSLWLERSSVVVKSRSVTPESVRPATSSGPTTTIPETLPEAVQRPPQKPNSVKKSRARGKKRHP